MFGLEQEKRRELAMRVAQEASKDETAWRAACKIASEHNAEVQFAAKLMKLDLPTLHKALAGARESGRLARMPPVVTWQSVVDSTVGSTGVGRGVAIPHARLPGLTAVHAVLVRLEKPIQFDAMDGEPVDLMLALFAPPEAGSEHLRALARVSRLLRRPEIREQLRQAQSADAILATLEREATPNAA